MEQAITQAQYQAFQEAYDFFNTELFASVLPNVLVTLQRHAKAYGYFSAERFSGRSSQETAHELALNPDHFGRTDEDILSTLAHEMAHVWQHTHGRPPRKSYHDREWAAKMVEIGLQPSSTGAPGGKPTGQSVSHYVIAGGAFAVAFAKLQATGFELRWQSRTDDPQRKKKANSKTKYTCSSCGTNAWAKPGSALICGKCYDEGKGEIRAMEAVEAE
jgi:predicted SprT family Zn-dependent metalloprotease